MKILMWNEWLEAQRKWARLCKHGMRAHTPESIFLTFNHRPGLACEYVNAD